MKGRMKFHVAYSGIGRIWLKSVFRLISVFLVSLEELCVLRVNLLSQEMRMMGASPELEV